MDAISFVLGIKSSHLRSTHLKDLVYRGRVLKHSTIHDDGTATYSANGHAEAGAEAGGGETPSRRHDPQTAWVMAVYEDDAGDEMRWKRSITATGQSEYRINNRVVTAKDYNEALEAENILIKARNFLVFQGDVESIANQNPRDLTRLVEQISGSGEYKADYERLKAEKERADEDQAQKLHQRRGINGEIRQYQQQKEELDRYQALADEKDEAIVTHVLWKLYHFQRTIQDSAADIQKHQEELKEFRRNVQKFEDELEKAKREQAKVDRDVSKVERELKRKEKALEEKTNELVPVDEKLSLTNSQVKTKEKKLNELRKERDLQQAATDKMQAQLDTVLKAQERWQNEWRAQQQSAGRALSDADLKEYQSLRGVVAKQAGNDRIKADNIARQLKTDEETVNSLKSKVETSQAQVASLEAEIAGLAERRTEVNSSVKSTRQEIDAKKKAINVLASERERTLQKARELDEKLREVLLKLQSATDFQRESRKEAQQKEWVSQMKRIYPGVRGMVHQLCKPKSKKYENAIVVALGRHWDAVVVDTGKVAQQCIQYLKDQRLGQMNFLPMDTLIVQQPNANLRGLHAGTRLAVDVLDFDPIVERAMNFACGNAIVTDTLQIARHLCYERGIDAKAVALDGSIIHKGGNLTGGEEPGGKKRHFEEAEVENLRTLAQKFKEDMEALPKGHKRQSEEEQLQSELSGLSTKLQYAQEEQETLIRNIESRTKELNHHRAQLAEAQPKYQEQAQGLETLRESLRQYTTSIAEVEDEVFAAFCQRLGYDNIREYERQQGSMQQEAQQKKHEFQTHISRLQNQVSFESQRLHTTDARSKKAEAEIERDTARISELEQEKEAISSEMDELNAEIEQLQEQLAELKEQRDERAEKVNEARRDVQKRSKNVEKTLKELAALEAEVQKASTGRYGVLKQAKLDNTDIPLERGSRKLDALPNEDVILEGDGDAMDVDNEEDRAPSTNDYGIRPDFSSLDSELKEDSSDKREAELQEKIASLTASLDKMSVNTRSADKLTQTSERLKATDKAYNDARALAKKASDAFEKVQSKRCELFKKAYEHISAQIDTVYKDLTRTTTFPLGGQASLDAEDDEEPYLAGIRYHAMPPLKRFRDMEHLSGGEKTMAALALLFAVHTFVPSPFFVLDEVDAALDNNNTRQLSEYVRSHAGPGMQFVVISLKTGFFEGSETLVGVMRDQGVNSSRALTLDVSTIPLDGGELGRECGTDGDCSCGSINQPKPLCRRNRTKQQPRGRHDRILC